MTVAPEGLLLVDKPAGPTSHDVVVRIRRALRQSRAGHTGTLDPMATGLLAIALGRATRLIRFLPAAPKVYAGTFVFGITTATDDTTGEVLSRFDGSLPSREAVVAAAGSLIGTSLQRPPTYSARRVGGERLYDLARRGETVEAPRAAIDVDTFCIGDEGPPGTWSFETSVSAGTYVRALVRDIGSTLGCGASLASLRRIAIGPLRIDEAGSIPANGRLDPAPLVARVIPLDHLPLAMPTIALSENIAIARFLGGNPAPLPDRLPWTPHSRVVDFDGRLLGIGECDATHVRPCVVIADPVAGAARRVLASRG